MQINSYVSDRHKKRKQRRKYFIVALGIIAAYLLFFVVQWVLLDSPIFQVDHVVIVGNSSVASSDIVSLVEASALPKHSLLPAVFSFNSMLLWPDQIPASQVAIIPQLASLSVSKDYFSHTVTITAVERVPVGIWCFSSRPGPIPQLDRTSVPTSTGDFASPATTTLAAAPNSSCYWFDDTGTLFEKSFDTQGNLIFVVNDAAQVPRGLNQKVLPPEFLPNFLSIISVLRQSGLAVDTIELNSLVLEEVDVVTENGPTIYFSLRFSADDYLPVIQKLILLPDFDNIQYIDCRTENRLYYK